MEILYLAVCAARCFADHHPGRYVHDDLRTRRIDRCLRAAAVGALRHLWKTGTVEQRVTVACCVVTLVGGDSQGTLRRVRARERRRAAAVANPGDKV